MSEHHLKTWTEYYEAVENGSKTFEVRLNDRDFKVGDLLVLEEWDRVNGVYTGRSCERTVSFILTGDRFGIDSRFVVMAIQDTDLQSRLADAQARAERAEGEGAGAAAALGSVLHQITARVPKGFSMEDWEENGPECLKCHHCMSLKDGCDWQDDPRRLVCDSCLSHGVDLAIAVIEKYFATPAPQGRTDGERLDWLEGQLDDSFYTLYHFKRASQLDGDAAKNFSEAKPYYVGSIWDEVCGESLREAIDLAMDATAPEVKGGGE